MRTFLGFMARLVLVNMLAAGPAFAGIAFDQSTTYTFTNCSSSGSVAQAINKGGDYVTSISGEGTWICIANSSSTCASGGTFLNAGVTMVLTIGNQLNSYSMSCRSTGGTGNVYLTRKGN